MQLHSLQKSTATSWWLDIFLLSLLLGSLYLAFLGQRPLFVPDEGRYAEIIREMSVSKDYVTPHLNQIKYFEKPILFYWLGAAAVKLGGLSVSSLRFINAMLGLLGCLLAYVTGRKLYDRLTGLLAAGILGTSLLYYTMAHIINLDMPVTFFITATLSFFLISQHPKQKQTSRYYFWLAAASAALAVLTKGLIGIVFPLMIVGTWLLLMNQWRLLLRWPLVSSFLLFFLIVLPWHLLAQQRNPEFFHLYIIEQHFLRYTQTDIGHYQPTWYFLPCLLLGFFPWVVFLPQAIKNSWPSSWQKCDEKAKELFLLLWASLIFIFFSFSKSKLISYILPVLPPLALLTAHYLRQCLVGPVKTSLQVSWFFMILFATTITIAAFIFLHNSPLPNPDLAKYYINVAALLLLTGILLSGIIGFRRTWQAAMLTIGTLWVFLQLIMLGLPAIDTRTILPLAQILKPILQEQDEVVTYNQYYQDLPFYLERRVTILNWQNELKTGMRYQDTKQWMINDSIFWHRWISKQRVFVVMSRDEYDKFQQKHPKHKGIILGKTINNILMVNHLK